MERVKVREIPVEPKTTGSDDAWAQKDKADLWRVKTEGHNEVAMKKEFAVKP